MLAGCGGDGGSNGLEDLVDGGTDITTDDGSSLDLGDVTDDCIKASAAFDEASQAFYQFTSGSGTTIDIDEFRSDIEEARSAVPNDIKDAYDVYMDAMLGYAEIYKNADPADPASAENLELSMEALTKLSSPEVLTAMEELTNYFITECTGG